VIADVIEAFQRYERALVTNDVAALDALFWNKSATLRFGVTDCGLLRPSSCNRFDAAPTKYRDSELRPRRRDYHTEFQRVGSDLIGRQSHVWLRTDSG
jgi:hypothetical protein